MARSLKAKDFLVPGKCFLIHKFQWVFHQHGVFSIKTGRLTRFNNSETGSLVDLAGFVGRIVTGNWLGLTLN